MQGKKGALVPTPPVGSLLQSAMADNPLPPFAVSFHRPSTMDHRPWTMGHQPCAIDHRLWTIDHGLWAINYGLITCPYLIFAGMKILMVCLGNICRSPLAEGILQHKANQAKVGWVVDSAGTANYHVGEPAHHLSQKVAKMNGVNISHERCRQFKKEDMLAFDRIYVMDRSNYADVKRMSRELWDAGKTDLILNELYPGEDREVPDPWYGTEKGYHDVFDMLNKACDRIIEKYKPQTHTPIA